MSVVLVEGNISAGKSTLCKELASRLGYRLFMEPTISNPYLKHFYQNPQKYALPMQIWLLRQRYNTYVEALEYMKKHRSGVVLDRSIFSDWVFAEKNLQDGNICSDGFKYYMTLRNQMLSVLPMPTCCVYLDVSAAECNYRVKYMRRREAEAGIPIEYLEGLNQCYRTFIADLKTHGVRVLAYDWNRFGSPDAVSDDVLSACKRPSVAMPLDVFDRVEQQAIDAARRAPYPFALVDELLVADGSADVEHGALSSTKKTRPSAGKLRLSRGSSDEEESLGDESFDESHHDLEIEI